MRVLVATNGRGRAHCMKFSVTHHAGQATTAQLGQRLSPLNFRLFALPLICEMEGFLHRPGHLAIHNCLQGAVLQRALLEDLHVVLFEDGVRRFLRDCQPSF